jgi:predicted transcriptional regulator
MSWSSPTRSCFAYAMPASSADPPVVDGDNHLVGICTRTDILQARSRHLVHETSPTRLANDTRDQERDGARTAGRRSNELTGPARDADQPEP